MTELRELNPGGRILMGPGPSDVHPRVLRAMSVPLVGHLDPDFLKIMDETQELLRHVFQTQNRLAIPVSGTGSAGMEACLVNLIEPGDAVVIGVNGVFGERMCDVASRCGAQVSRAEAEWGRVIEPEAFQKAMAGKKAKLVATVHAETSTGAHQPLPDVARLAHEAGALFVVDMVTSLGGAEVQVDAWGIDAAYSGTQKCLSCPPGLAPVTFGPRAVEALKARKTKVQSWYLDLTMVEKYWGPDRTYHHTAPITMNYALREALRLVREEGLEARWARHQLNHRALAAGLDALGIRFWSQEGHRLPMLNAVVIPPGVDDLKVRKALLNDYHIEIGGGLGAGKGKVWRIGLMGESSCRHHVLYFLNALETILAAEKVKFERGAAAAEAAAVYALAIRSARSDPRYA
ncbi:MAG: alanine--glyoxylate aminotransferase family protein [Planctomycetes bacterium]|nr:alanine--glyoxylate aminotransferase family protein [Planctomycetota bacterium]